MFPKTLAELKRTAPNFTFTMVQHWMVEAGPVIHGNCGSTVLSGPVKFMGTPCKVKKLQTNSMQFEPIAPDERGSWLDFRKAKDYKFEGNKMIVDVDGDGTFKKTMTYELAPV